MQPNERQRQQLIESGRVVLATLLRETDPVTYADERGISVAAMERGIDVVLFPMVPARRLPLESYIGYVAYKNGLPVAYGGGWIFLNRCKIGINIFPPYRGGESAFLFHEILRCYSKAFQVYKFIVEPYQVGKNNMEGIRSGAYWFYYRLGFRSVSKDVMALAEAEFGRITNEKGYRSSPETMKQLAGSNLQLDVFHATVDTDPQKISHKVNTFLNENFAGNRDKCLQSVDQTRRRWKREVSVSIPEGELADSLLLVAMALTDVSSWKRKQAELLAYGIQLRAGGEEHEFIRWSQHAWNDLFGDQPSMESESVTG